MCEELRNSNKICVFITEGFMVMLYLGTVQKVSANFGKSLHVIIFLGREGLYLLLASQKASDPTKILSPLAWRIVFEN